MEKINYKTDFDFTLSMPDCNGHETGFPKCDFTATVFTLNRLRPFVASQKNGVLTNCYNDNGRLHIVCDNHGLSCGRVMLDLELQVPNPIYPDRYQRVSKRYDTGIELVHQGGDCPRTAEIEVLAPYVYTSAYELARQAGFTGTEEEYISYLNDMPAIVEQAENLNAFASEWAKGKRSIINALEKWGKDADFSDSFEDLSQKILQLPVRGDSEEGIISHDMNGSSWDLLNELNNHQRLDYPYCWGVLLDDSYEEVELNGADAYYTSDGRFYESNTTHRFTDNENKSGRYIIFYYSYAEYTVNPIQFPIIEKIICLNGKPKFNISSTTVIPSIESYTKEKYALIDIEFAFGGNQTIRRLILDGITNILYTTMQGWSLANLIECSFPSLEEYNGNAWLSSNLLQSLFLPKLKTSSGVTVFNFANLKSLKVPNLEKVTAAYFMQRCNLIEKVALPKLKEISGGTLISDCTNLKELDLPALVRMTGGYLANACAKLETINFPNLEELRYSGSFIIGLTSLQNIAFPKLKYSSVALICNSNFPEVIEFPELEEAYGHILNQASGNQSEKIVTLKLPKLRFANGAMFANLAGTSLKKVYTELGSPQDGNINLTRAAGDNNIVIAVSVQKGFRSYLNVSALSNMTQEELEAIIDNLGDNTEHDPIQIVFGAVNLAKISDEKKQLAVQKNYTLS